MDLGDYDAVLIDGRSGSGKTTLTERLVARQRLDGVGVQVMHVEDLYPGWDGLAAGSESVATALDTGGYRRYDWVAGEFGEWVPLASERPLVIEGCGAITTKNIQAARGWAKRMRASLPEPGAARIHAVWLEGPADLRRKRALARDGETFRPHWDRWAAQEEQLFAITLPTLHADEIIRIE